MKSTCLIADDEPLAIQLLEKYVNDSEMLTLIGTCSNALEVSGFLHQEHVDLLFLDIQMPKLTGLELLRVLRDPPAVIITTAHREYALEGYEFEIIDYLLKPITFQRFLTAIDKFNRRKVQHFSTDLSAGVDKIILLKSGINTYQFFEREIIYIESTKDFIKIHLINGKKPFLKYRIGQLERELSKDFMRVHKSFIINKSSVTVYNATHIELGEVIIPIGSTYSKNAERNFKFI